MISGFLASILIEQFFERIFSVKKQTSKKFSIKAPSIWKTHLHLCLVLVEIYLQWSKWLGPKWTTKQNVLLKCYYTHTHTLLNYKWCERKLVSQKWKQIKQVWTHFQSPKVAINVYLSLSKWWFSLNSQECQDSRNSRRRNLKLFLFFLLSISSFFKKKIFCQSLE